MFSESRKWKFRVQHILQAITKIQTCTTVRSGLMHDFTYKFFAVRCFGLIL
jgi:hypothetical protein